MTTTPGTGATYRIGSDYYPMTVVWVSPTGHVVHARPCETRHGRFFLETTEKPEVFTRRGDGAYRPKGCKYGRLNIGERRLDLDPGF